MSSLETGIFLLTIKPKYAEAILSGRKKYELRRLRGPSITSGSLVILYVSGDTKSIIGEFIAGEVIKDTPDNVWKAVRKPGTGIGREVYRYIKGSRLAQAVEVLNPRLYKVPVTLEEIRNIIPGWNPPHSYIKLRHEDPLYRLIIEPLRVS